MRDQRPSAPASSSTARCHLPDSHALGAHSRAFSIIGWLPSEEGLNQRIQDRRQARRSLWIEPVRRRFGHVAAPAHFQLSRMHALARAAVAPHDVTALEAAVDYLGEIALSLQ